MYFGTGNTNRGFTVYQSNPNDPNFVAGLELGLRAHSRYPADDSQSTSPTPGLMNQGNGVYGSFPAATLGPAGRSSFNFDFSINSNYNGNGTNLTLDVGGLHYALLIDSDAGAGITFTSFDPLAIPDNGYGTSSAEVADGTSVLALTNNVAQNSQNMGFFPIGFNPNANGLYDIALIALNANNVEVGRVQIEVVVGEGAPVPEPASMAIWGIGALGCAVAGYRRRKQAV